MESFSCSPLLARTTILAIAALSHPRWGLMGILPGPQRSLPDPELIVDYSRRRKATTSTVCTRSLQQLVHQVSRIYAHLYHSDWVDPFQHLSGNKTTKAGLISSLFLGAHSHWAVPF